MATKADVTVEPCPGKGPVGFHLLLWASAMTMRTYTAGPCHSPEVRLRRLSHSAGPLLRHYGCLLHGIIVATLTDTMVSGKLLVGQDGASLTSVWSKTLPKEFIIQHSEY